MATNSNPPFPDPYVGSRHHEVAGQHQYPVWWTGDNVPLVDAVRTMVDQGITGFTSPSCTPTAGATTAASRATTW
jgi:hypothetical protein